MKTIGRIVMILETLVITMVIVTYLDIVSHNIGPNRGNYWLPTTEAAVEWLEEYEAEQSASFSFGHSSASTRRCRDCLTAAKTQLQFNETMTA
jgi:hypothetical protein